MLEFLKAYQQWVFDGAPEHRVLTRDFGLCRIAFEWGNGKLHTALTERLKKDFPDTWRFPFGGQKFYYCEADAGDCHRNPERMKWVDETITKLTLLEFLGDWQLWALMSSPGDKQFSRCVGLCDQVPTLSKPLLKYLLRRDFRTSLSPFDHGEVHFSEESEQRTMHLNPRRLEWVAKIIEELK